MGRKYRRARPDWWLPPKDFRLARIWVRRELLEQIKRSGEIMAGQLVSHIANGNGNPPSGFMTLPYDRRRKMVWNMANTLESERLIESFRHRGGTYLHFRMVNALDRMAHALGQETKSI